MLNISQTWNDIGYELKDLSKQYQEEIEKITFINFKSIFGRTLYHLFVKIIYKKKA